MKTIYRFFAAALMLCMFLCIGNSVYGAADGWYVNKNSEHKQPRIPAEFAYIENLGGYFIDKNHGDGNVDKVIYLTFDAGYENGNVEKTLDILKKHGVKAAFFVLKHLIVNNTDLVKRIGDEGHLICNHTMSHPDMSKCSEEKIRAEITGLEKICIEKTGYEIAKFYRPPQGKFSESDLKTVNSMGYKTVFWSFAYADWDNNKQPSPDSAIKKVMDNIHNGEIMLLHPTSATNALILDKVISELKAQGYRFETLDKL